ncbi:MAG: response regulator transcription factor [bacterium]|nr:response regulator transcription factor [bacterium]
MPFIFILDNNDDSRKAVSGYLRLSEYEVIEFKELTGFKEALTIRKPDLLVMETDYPDGDGFLLVKELRLKTDIPIIFISGRSTETDRITGFEVGADDYMVKPISIKELALRIAVILKRINCNTGNKTETIWALGENILLTDESSHKAEMNGKLIKLTAAEWKILTYLTSNDGTVVSREQILDRCLEYSFEGYDRTVDTHIKNLRAKLIDPNWIETVRGYGYRFAGLQK